MAGLTERGSCWLLSVSGGSVSPADSTTARSSLVKAGGTHLMYLKQLEPII